MISIKTHHPPIGLASPHSGMRPAGSPALAPVCLALFIGMAMDGNSLPETMANWSPVVRKAAAKHAANAGPAALPELLEALGSANPGMRHAATQAIVLIARKEDSRTTGHWQEITVKLTTVLKEDKDFWTRCGAAAALKAIRPEAAAAALLEAAGDPNPWVAAAAVDAVSGMPVKAFEPENYLATALKSLSAPRSETRCSGIRMLGLLGAPARKVMPEVETSVGTFSHDSMFADRPRIDAIVWIARFDRRKAAALANGLLLEDRWGASGRCGKLVPFLGTLGQDATPATEGLKRAATLTKPKDKACAARARKILASLNP